MVHWSDAFWGEGNRGFELLSSNVKSGAIAIEEFQRFLNESAQCESTYCRSLSRLQSQLTKVQQLGTFTPIWSLIREFFDRTTAAHLTVANAYQDLLRDLHNYQEVLPKKVKTHILKDADISKTADLIAQLNHALAFVNKAKEQYHLLTLDYERAKRSGSASNNNLSNTSDTTFSSRQLERLEKKYRQAQEEYKLAIEKYNSIRDDYEKRFSEVCAKFQNFEIDHIEKMLAFSLTYSSTLEQSNEQIQTAQNEFNQKLKAFTGHDLLEAFVEDRKTGTERPAVLQFEEVDSLAASSSLSDLPSGQDESSLGDSIDASPPSSQTSSATKHNDNSRALSPISSNNHRHPSANAISSSNGGALMNSSHAGGANSHPSTRSQESGGGHAEQTSNPFNLQITKNKLTGLFASSRKVKSRKKDGRSPTGGKLSKKSRAKQQRDGSNSASSQKSTRESGGSGRDVPRLADLQRTSSTDPKGKSATPVAYTQSNSPIPTGFSDPLSNQSSILFSSAATLSRLSSSSDTSDDDDSDDPVSRIDFKIKPIATTIPDAPISEEDHQTKIMDAMRQIGLNIGSSAGNSRRVAPVLRTSKSNAPIATRTPPPVPPRLNTSVSIDQPSTSPDDPNPASTNVTDDENLSVPQPLLTPWSGNENNKSVSSSEDDREVANSFPSARATPADQSVPQTNWSTPTSPMNGQAQERPPSKTDAIDQIPLAVAFQETIDATLSGDNQETWNSHITGELLISFPASMLTILADGSGSNKPLDIRLKNLDHVQNITLKSPGTTQSESNEFMYSFDMNELLNTLRHQREKSPSSPFFNLAVLNYQVNNEDTSQIPVHLSSKWTRTLDTISVIIDYRFNSSQIPDSIRFNNEAMIIYSIIADGREIQASAPTAGWANNEHKLWWKVPYVKDGSGSLSATIRTEEAEQDQQDQPLTMSSKVNAYFLGENGLFSSLELELITSDYRVSLLKKKIISGKYQSEPDQSAPIHLFQRPALAVPETP